MTFKRTYKKGDRVRVNAQRGHFVRYCGDGHNAVVEFDGSDTIATVALDDMRHAPVTIVGPRPSVPTTCPDGHLLEASDAEEVDPRTGTRRAVRVVACGFCDFVQEVRK